MRNVFVTYHSTAEIASQELSDETGDLILPGLINFQSTNRNLHFRLLVGYGNPADHNLGSAIENLRSLDRG